MTTTSCGLIIDKNLQKGRSIIFAEEQFNFAWCQFAKISIKPMAGRLRILYTNHSHNSASATARQALETGFEWYWL